MFSSKKTDLIDQQIQSLAKQIDHINRYLTVIGSSTNVKDRINSLKSHLSDLDGIITTKRDDLFNYEKQALKQQEVLAKYMDEVDIKIIKCEKMLEQFNKTKRKIKDKINKHLLILHSCEAYISDYSKIYTSLSDRVYIDVCGEKILVTKFDGVKSPVIASIMNSECRTFDLVEPETFKEVLHILRNNIVICDKYKDCWSRYKLSNSLKLFKIKHEFIINHSLNTNNVKIIKYSEINRSLTMLIISAESLVDPFSSGFELSNDFTLEDIIGKSLYYFAKIKAVELGQIYTYVDRTRVEEYRGCNCGMAKELHLHRRCIAPRKEYAMICHDWKDHIFGYKIIIVDDYGIQLTN